MYQSDSNINFGPSYNYPFMPKQLSSVVQTVGIAEGMENVGIHYPNIPDDIEVQHARESTRLQTPKLKNRDSREKLLSPSFVKMKSRPCDIIIETVEVKVEPPSSRTSMTDKNQQWNGKLFVEPNDIQSRPNSDYQHSELDLESSVGELGSAYEVRTTSATTGAQSSYLKADTNEPDVRPDSKMSYIMRERLRSFAQSMTSRTSKVKKVIQRPPTPDSVSVTSNDDEKEKKEQEPDQYTLHAFVADIDPPDDDDDDDDKNKNEIEIGQVHTESPCVTFRQFLVNCFKKICFQSIEVQSKWYLVWLMVMSLTWLYNIMVIPLRATYPYETDTNRMYWFIADYSADLLYIIDMTLFKPRLRFVKQGLKIKDKKEMRKHYLRSTMFKWDLVSILPYDILYLAVGHNSLVRLPRVLRINCYFNVFYALDSKLKSPYALRIAKTFSYMFILIHCNSCCYYSLSVFIGLGSNTWVYSGNGNAYIRCTYFTTKLATSIGNNPAPTNVFEYMYVLCSWMMGVFVFAILLGQIRDIVATANKNRENYRQRMDTTLNYCKTLNLPDALVEKVRMWFIHIWDEQKTLSTLHDIVCFFSEILNTFKDEMALIEKLPIKMQTDLAISVHYQDCDKTLLRALVLKLTPVLFLPGDYVCRKGEVGKEMYIVNKGMVQVVGGPNGDTVFVTLKEGSVFGEISLLSIDGGDNRRTADVRAKGFAILFVLSKSDLHDTIVDYPDAQRALKRKAKDIMKKSQKREDTKDLESSRTKIERASTIESQMKTPQFLKTVLQVADPKSPSVISMNEKVRQEEIFNFDEKESDVGSDMHSVMEQLKAQLQDGGDLHEEMFN